MKIIKIPKIYFKLLNSIVFQFILCLVPMGLAVYMNNLLSSFENNATSSSFIIKYFYTPILYIIILIIIMELIRIVYESIFLLSNTGKQQGYYEIKIKLPKLVKKNLMWENTSDNIKYELNIHIK